LSGSCIADSVDMVNVDSNNETCWRQFDKSRFLISNTTINYPKVNMSNYESPNAPDMPSLKVALSESLREVALSVLSQDHFMPQCDNFVYEYGEPLLEADITECGELVFEDWVVQVRVAVGQGQLIDWYNSDLAQVLFVGNFDVIATAAKSIPCPAVIVRWAE
jgi:hypothetical protein